jgi:hypothetical protein
MTSNEDKKLKIEFAPGAFDSFEGTQEELEEMIAEITRMAESGELFEQSTAVDLDELMEDEPKWAEQLIANIDGNNKRTLQ